ncbi:TlpA family protein disulfide reductase [bacterium]|nr:TlpA family protein disulfide reductase [bacterium]
MKYLKFLGCTVLALTLVWSLSLFSMSCDDDDDDPTPTPTPTVNTETPTPTNPPEGKDVGDLAYNFTLNDRNETPHELWSYWGKVILLDISAMWCGPCKTEASKAEALYQQYKDQGLMILSVLFEDLQGNPANAADCATWADKYGLTFPVLYDNNRQVWNLFNTEGYIPLNLVMDRNMVIRYKDVGYNESAIKSMIESLL